MKLRLSILIILSSVVTVASLQASGVISYSDWATFLKEGLVSIYEETADSCTFTATGDVTASGWTGNSSTATSIPGTVVMDGNGYAMNGNSTTFGGYNVDYSGDLVVKNWSSWHDFVQNGGVSTTERHTTLFTVSSGSMTVSNSTFENNYFHPNLGAVVTGGLIRSSSKGSTSPSGSLYGLYITDSNFVGNTTTAPDSTSNTNASGLVICNSGTALIENSTFVDNAITVTFTNADRCGGAAIRNDDGGTMTINSVSFVGNKAMFGGAIYNAGADTTGSVKGSSITMTDCYFEGNGTPYNSSGNTRGGGAIYTDGYGTSLSITNTQFINNQGNNGGAIMDNSAGSSAYWDSYTISGSTFSGNLAVYGSGGALYGSNYSKWTAEGNTFEGNSAQAGYGGAAYFSGDYVVANFSGSGFTENTASKGGGAVYLSSKYADANFDGASFSRNSATGSGGGVYISGSSAKASFAGADFSGNTATSSGGAVYMYGTSATAQFDHAEFSGNSATGNGGAAYLGSSSARFAFIDTNFTDNSAGGSGGALYLYRAQAVVAASNENVTFSGNSSGDGTGAIHLYGSGATLYLNAGDGKSITFEGDGISGTSNSTHTVYINRAGVDSNVITADTQEAGTGGTVAFKDSAFTQVTLKAEGGALNMDATALEYTLVEAMSSKLTLANIHLKEGSAFTLGADATATVSGMTLSPDASAVAFTLNSSTASLVLKNTLTIALDGLYTSASDIALDDTFSYQLVALGADEGASFDSLSVEDLSVTFTYGGDVVAYNGIVNMNMLRTSGVVTIISAPEPTTATLSLLALSMLATRRRRR